MLKQRLYRAVVVALLVLLAGGCAPRGGSAYLRGVIEEIQARYSVDASSIYIVGLSNGGFMAHRMACDHADLVTGLVSVAGAGQLDAGACEPEQPVAVLQIHGDADRVIRYVGGSLGVRYPGARQTVEDWAARNGCATTAREGKPRDLVLRADLGRPRQPALAGAETSVAIYDEGCEPGGHVELWTMAGADHLPALAPSFGAQIVEFLLAHRRPD